MKITEQLRLLNTTNTTSERIIKAVEACLLSSAKIIATVAQKNHPTFKNITGNAERSIKYRITEDNNVIASEVYLDGATASSGWKRDKKYPYSAFLNDGTTRGIRAGNFIRNAYLAKAGSIAKETKDSINRALRSVF
jgi:opacity protein-like surface antigen